VGKTVLIVEDDQLHMKLFVDLFEANGISSVYPTDGSDVMPLAAKHRPDLIIMDIQLPGESGVTHIEKLKADPDLADIPILVVTAFAMKGDDQRFLAAGCDGYMSKPIDAVRFMNTVNTFIE